MNPSTVRTSPVPIGDVTPPVVSSPSSWTPPKKISGRSVGLDRQTIPSQLLQTSQHARLATPNDTQIFICIHRGCNKLFPSLPKLQAHQTQVHREGDVPRDTLTWFDPEADAKLDEQDRLAEIDRRAEAARRSFLPLGSGGG
ncbi:Zinc finger C2H2-type/integrase DNA-binding domain [Phaffia rhodozyma]|uniref:Zinc finger C2H2-type/integrase DNA-binding domain n=1 Tax=Phaffia rhodozyma TaxID=264483 RepID=A0A0F7SIJ2_PHARH|nr:Zinc finger C2H2-type/integrase DNA-binding domain [Phaffia rhodozyma]